MGNPRGIIVFTAIPLGVQRLFIPHMKLAESPECTNCDRRGRDDAWHTQFECPVFQLYWEDVMTNLQQMGDQPFTPNSLVLIMLKSTDGWDQVAAFVALTMHRKMKIAQESLCQTSPSSRVCYQQPSNGGRRKQSRLVSFGDIWQPI